MSKKRYEYQKGSKSEQNVTRNRQRAQEKTKEKKNKDWTNMDNISNVRSRKFCINTYMSVNRLENFLRIQPWISHWCYTSHDRDKKEDGTTKDFHTHVLLYTYNAKSASAVRKIFDRYEEENCKEGETPQNTLVQLCTDMVSQYRYQLHLDDKDKAQYSFNERYCDNYAWWHKLEVTDGMNEPKNFVLAIIDDILAGVPSYVLAERYGKDYVYHIQHFQKFIAQHNRETMLNNCNGMDISDYFVMLLENSPLQKESITIFFMVLDYIKRECMLSYNSKLNFYLDERK